MIWFDNGKHGKSTGFRKDEHIAKLWLWSGFFGPSKAECNTMLVDKGFCVSMDGSFGRRILCKENKFISMVRAYSIEYKLFPLILCKLLSVINVLSGTWRITADTTSYQKLDVDLWCCEIEHSELAVSRLGFWIPSSCCSGCALLLFLLLCSPCS